MKYALGMGGGQAGTELARNVEGFVLGQAPDTPQKRRKVFAIDILHGKKNVAFHVADVIDAANIRMRHTPCNPHLILKTLQESLIAGGFVGQKLESDRLAECQVVGSVHFTHAPFSQQRNDAVAPSKQSAGKEAAFARVVSGTRRTK
jgi:hypothetical protein